MPVSLGFRLVLGAALATAVGCGSGSAAVPAGTSPPAPSATPSPTPTVGLIGTYTTTLTGHERFRGPTITLPDGQPPGGTWRLTIEPTQAVMKNPQGDTGFPLGASFSYTSAQMTFGADPNCSKLDPPTATTGVYTYQLNGPVLTIHLVSDGCLGRAATLTSHPWRR